MDCAFPGGRFPAEKEGSEPKVSHSSCIKGKKNLTTFNRFAEKNNLPVLHNVTVPRVGAMKAIVDVLGSPESPCRRGNASVNDVSQQKTTTTTTVDTATDSNTDTADRINEATNLLVSSPVTVSSEQQQQQQQQIPKQNASTGNNNSSTIINSEAIITDDCGECCSIRLLWEEKKIVQFCFFLQIILRTHLSLS